MKQIFTLVCVISVAFFINPVQSLSQPVNTHRSFTWDGWPANSLSQPNFFASLGPDNIKVGLTISFSGIASANPAKTYTYANQSGRTSSLKIEKLPGSEDTMYAVLTFNKDLTGFNMDINPFNSTSVVIQAYNIAGSRVAVKGAYDYLTDSVPRKGDTLINNINRDVHICFNGPVSKITYKVIRTNATANGMEFAVGAASWFNTAAYTPNPDLNVQCDDNQILLILDASTSIDATERSELIGAVESMLNTLQYYAVTPNYISIVEFCRQATLALPVTKVTPASIAPGGVIYDYLHNTNGNGYYSTNAIYGGQTNWSQAFKVALDQARVKKPNLLIFFTDGAPNRVYEANVASNANFLQSAAWGINRTSLYADTIKQMGTHLLGVGTDKINTTTQDFYFRYAIEMVNPILYDYLTPPPSNIATADYVSVSAFPYLKQVFNNLFFSCLNYLPLNFSSVQVQQHKCMSNTISWKMDDEEGGIYYAVEKSIDGNRFTSIGRIEKFQAIQQGLYAFEDNNLDAKTIYYRIKAVSTSGHAIYSKVVMVQNSCLNNQLAIWPNPVRSDKLNLQLQSQYKGLLQVTVFDMTGRLLLNQILTKNQDMVKVEANVSGLPTGIYTLKICDSQHQVLFKEKFVKQ